MKHLPIIPNTQLICYADTNMQTSQELCMKSAFEKGCIEQAYGFGPDDIDSEFQHRNLKILLQEQRGGGKGHWLWKPYLCEQALRLSSIGDYTIYADSGIEFIASIQPLIDLMEKSGEEILLFGNNHRHIEWTKQECINAMLSSCLLDCRSTITQKEQVQASVMIFKNSPFTETFTREWLAWSEMPGLIDDQCDMLQQYANFKGHRNDQSILTNLAIKYNIKLHWWPPQYGHHIKGNYPDEGYGQLFFHHRWRESDWQANNLTIGQFMLQQKN